MDLWVVAAAAGAGYVAKFLKRAKEREGELGVEESGGKVGSSSGFEHSWDVLSPIRKSGDRKFEGEECRQDGMVSSFETSTSHGFVASEVASTSGVEGQGEMLGSYGSIEDYNVLSLSGVSPRFVAKANKEDSTMGSGNIVDRSSRKFKGGVRTKIRQGYTVKVVNSLDSCLEAHLNNEHSMEEYLFASFPSPPPPSTRPLIVTDGRRVISRASSDSCSLRYNSCKEGDMYADVKENIIGVPTLPEIVPSQILKKVKQKRKKEPHGRCGGSGRKLSSRQLNSQGPSDGMFLFCLGITFGVLATVVANKKEVDKLNALLKETKNLVEDLHEELEMKDSLTVKVITHERIESLENNHALTRLSSGGEMNASPEYDIRTVENLSENFDSMSKIEAELEAELERLELNINTSTRGRRSSGLVEIDPDSLADIAQGELRADMLSRVAGVESNSRRDTSGTSTTKTHDANYAVSPRELSLRLHEVIESRLEERITELEAALNNSQKRLQSIEPKPMNPWMNYSTSEMGSSSHESPTTREPNNTTTQPMFLDLSDDALDAYKEAYEALNIRIAGTDEDTPPFTEYKSPQKEELHLLDRSVLWDRNEGGENGSESNEVIEIQAESDEEEDDDDEMRRLLIKKLVEKTRQGSPVVLNAQRMLFSMDEKSPLG